ncbi:MAG: hypothetical protein C4589_00245 [Peptococcaceae bacterium]|nr:MAG: hypothetical protein C4589_00245 [Peptococcaceae bacterium]
MSRNTFYNVKPAFVVDPNSIARNSGRQIDWDNLPDSYRQGAVTATAATNAASGATQIQVAALAGAIPVGTVLYFGEVGEFARLSASAAAGTTQLPVDATGTTIESGDAAIYPGTGAKMIPAGQAVCELTGGKIIPRVNRPGSEVCLGFLETTAIENEPGHSKSGYSVIVGGVLYENLLPDATAGATTGTISQDYKNELASATNGNAVGFAFEQYQDNRS